MSDPYRSTAVAGPGTQGILLALAAICLAFFPTGAGHGWVAPFLFSFPLLIIYPFALVRSRAGRGTGIGPDIALVGIALAADVALCLSSIDYRTQWLRGPLESVVPGVDRSVFPIFLIWLMLWLHWQFVALRSLLRHVRRRPQ